MLHGWKEDSMLVKRIAAYPSIFNCLRAIARYWSEIATFTTPLHLTPPLGCSHWNSRKKFGPQKLESWGYVRQCRQFDDRLSCFDTIPACDGQTDRQTDVQPISITCTVWLRLTHVKNRKGTGRISDETRWLALIVDGADIPAIGVSTESCGRRVCIVA